MREKRMRIAVYFFWAFVVLSYFAIAIASFFVIESWEFDVVPNIVAISAFGGLSILVLLSRLIPNPGIRGSLEVVFALLKIAAGVGAVYFLKGYENMTIDAVGITTMVFFALYFVSAILDLADGYFCGCRLEGRERRI